MGKKSFGAISLALGLALIMGALAGPASAGNVAVKANIQQHGIMTLTSPTVDFGSILPSDSAINLLNAQAVTVKTNNNNWSLTQYMDSDFQTVNNAKITLQWKKNGTSTLNNMSVSGANPDSLVSGGTRTASTSYAVDYGVLVPWTLPTGSYTGSVTYTLTMN